MQVVGGDLYFVRGRRQLLGVRIPRSLARDAHVANGLLVFSLATLGMALSYNDAYMQKVVPQARVRNALVLATGALYAFTVLRVLHRRFRRADSAGEKNSL